MDLVTLGRAVGFSFTAGINLYATVAILGLAARYDWVALPPQFELFDNDVVIGVALALYAIEFFADKIPWVDTIWDGLHTFVRPLGGALIAVAALGEASPAVQGLVALLGGTVATGTHVAKAGTRAAVNTSPEPVTNALVSLTEDGFVVSLGLVALAFPLAALAISVVLFVLIVIAFARLFGLARRRLGVGRAASRPSTEVGNRGS